ncbi:MAG: hypothetical protein A2X22_13025 [Bacteroidetes bacterium GWF2_49_14]|nr:MAG: hypothetical protein A2X22_13025 [Bacteroidetes bacterium GWF2_49_14]
MFFRLNAQSFNDQIYQSYITGDMDRWERLLKENDGKMYKPEGRYNYALACYGFIGYMIGEDEKPRSRPYLNRAEVIVDGLLMENPDVPKYMALRCALYGFRAEYQPGKIPSLLPKGMKLMSEAEKSGANSPQVWLEMGNRDWFLPVALGGSDLNAIEEYKKAIGMMEALPGFTRNNWYYLKAYKILIGWYEKLNFRFQATETCRKLLTIEPDFVWARRELNNLTGFAITRNPDGP